MGSDPNSTILSSGVNSFIISRLRFPVCRWRSSVSTFRDSVIMRIHIKRQVGSLTHSRYFMLPVLFSLLFSTTSGGFRVAASGLPTPTASRVL